MRHLLELLGYRRPEDVIELIVTGMAILPPLLMLSGHYVAGGLALWSLLCLLAVAGSLVPPPEDGTKENGDRRPRS